ncbi:hypothetical protein C8J57DRAFT_749911 [Mycena rebaudengoi]|nr:hypothetical protein C8J57DRAFT_749911 [Mycena rebaudengoi]
MLDDIANGRTSRSAKGDPALFNLISHSRSRSPSRSKGDKEAVEVSAVDVPELRAEQPSPQSPHKPASLLLSRPLSAATAGTASTVTPNNATPRKRAPAPIPIATVQEEIPAAPKQQLAVKKNFQFFGITLPSPRKSSFSSRSNTPLPPEAAPPSVRAPSPPSRASPSPIPKPKPKIKIKPNLVGEGPAPTSRMDNFSKFFVGTGMRVSSDPQPPPPPAATPSKATVSPSKIPTMKHTSKSTTVPQAHVSASTIVAVPSAKPKLAPGPRKTMSEARSTLV